jgi:hypothetical protein
LKLPTRLTSPRAILMLSSGSGRKIVSDWNKLSEAGRGRNRSVTPVPVKPSSKCETTQVRVVPFQITKGITARIERLASKQSRIQSRSLLRLRAPVPSHPCAAPELVQVMTAQLLQSPGRWHSRSPGRRKGFIRFADSVSPSFKGVKRAPCSMIIRGGTQTGKRRGVTVSSCSKTLCGGKSARQM